MLRKEETLIVKDTASINRGIIIPYLIDGEIMSTCEPIRILKDTSTFASIVNERGNITITKNGKEAFHCLSNERYEALMQDKLRSELLFELFKSEKEYAEGNIVSLEEDNERIRKKYGL